MIITCLSIERIHPLQTIHNIITVSTGQNVVSSCPVDSHFVSYLLHLRSRTIKRRSASAGLFTRIALAVMNAKLSVACTLLLPLTKDTNGDPNAEMQPELRPQDG
jgi:hypothetical protein